MFGIDGFEYRGVEIRNFNEKRWVDFFMIQRMIIFPFVSSLLRADIDKVTAGK